jgi:hypothetical protein
VLWRLDGGKLHLDKIEELYRLDGDDTLFAEW